MLESCHNPSWDLFTPGSNAKALNHRDRLILPCGPPDTPAQNLADLLDVPSSSSVPRSLYFWEPCGSDSRARSFSIPGSQLSFVQITISRSLFISFKQCVYICEIWSDANQLYSRKGHVWCFQASLHMVLCP